MVVDDGSTDPGTLEVFRSLEAEAVSVVHRSNGGLGAARMTGVLVTSSDYVFCLDADDRLLPGALEKLAAALDGDPGLALAWGAPGSLASAAGARRQHRLSIRGRSATKTTCRRRCWSAAQRSWRPEGGSCAGDQQDWDVLMGLAERGGRGIRVPIVVYEYRQHGVRMLGESATRHGEIYALLRSRHGSLFADRRRAWRRADVPWPLKLALPIIFALPIGPNRRRLLAGAASGLARRRGLALLLRRIKSGG